ncbi:hypothetical protein J3U16_12030, partial [Gilliamella sp. B3023]|uniref:hypothetical protein n=1 Tax=Gilliamella sp. B3023 TaxID=2817987 RepID=UPI002269DCB6
PQTFELVGRDSNGTPVVKYGFTLKQWFVHRGDKYDSYSNTLSWCNSIGYRMPRVKDLTNASCSTNDYDCLGSVGATPSSQGNHIMRHIGSGFFTEWGKMEDYSGVGGFNNGHFYWTSDPDGSDPHGNDQFMVSSYIGFVHRQNNPEDGLCSHP